jgi:hypothetical protein
MTFSAMRAMFVTMKPTPIEFSRMLFTLATI